MRPLRAGMICAVAFGVGLVLFLHHTGRLTLPGTGSSDAVPSPPITGVALEDRNVVARVKQADSSVKIGSLVVSQQPAVGRVTVTRGDTLVYAPPPNFNGRSQRVTRPAG